MKKFVIVLFILGIGIGAVLWLSKGSQETIVGTSQNVERPAGAADASRYADSSGFSFEKLAGYEIRTIADESGKTLIFEKGGAAGTGFQMFVAYYDEPATDFTAARIKKDLPDLAMKNVKEFDIAGGRGVSFDSDSVREIWFVAGESLYQITAPQTESANAQKVADTFKLD